MKNSSALGLAGIGLVWIAASGPAAAQNVFPGPEVSYPSSMSVSPPLASLPNATFHGSPQDLVVHPRPPLPTAAGVLPSASAVLQSQAGAAITPGNQGGFAGMGENGSIPSDANIAVGPTEIVQVVNSQIAVYDKSGNFVKSGNFANGPIQLGAIWKTLGGGGSACATQNAGDPVVQYDRLAANSDGTTGRWLITQLGSLSSPYSECIAVSQTGDPTGTYNLYSYSFGNYLNDYPKFGIWPTGANPAYLATYNLFLNGHRFYGAKLCAYDRSALLSGATSPAQICNTVGGGGYLPSDVDGATAPGNSEPGYFLALNTSTLSSLHLYTLVPNFALPSSSVFKAQSDIAVAAFGEACNGGSCIPQPGTSEKLDSLGDRLMYRLAYRNFGTTEAIVVNHSVTAGSSVGVRWYQLTAPVPTAAGAPASFALAQQGTYAPDSNYRWMGSAAMDGNGDIALGYSLSSGTVAPSIVATYRCPLTTPNTMGGEYPILAGTGSQTGYTRWGDYTALRIDPSNDTTFWYTNEYYTQTSPYVWSTWIGSFSVGNCP